MNTKFVGKFTIEKKLSKNGVAYVALIADLGYTKKYVNCDVNTIAELINVSVSHLYEMLEKGILNINIGGQN